MGLISSAKGLKQFVKGGIEADKEVRAEYRKQVETPYVVPIYGSYLYDGSRAYYFDITTKEEINCNSTTTAHYVEAGYSIQDHVVHHPIRYVLSGMIAEKVHRYAGEPSVYDYVQQARAEDRIRKLQTLGGLCPQLSNFAYSAKNVGTAVVNKIDSAVSMVMGMGLDLLFGDFKGFSPLIFSDQSTELQQKMFSQLNSIRESGQLLELRCPYGYFRNVIIEEVRVGQNESWSVSDITVVVKEIRTAESSTHNSNSKEDNSDKTDTELQKEEKKNLGLTNSTPDDNETSLGDFEVDSNGYLKGYIDFTEY